MVRMAPHCSGDSSASRSSGTTTWPRRPVAAMKHDRLPGDDWWSSILQGKPWSHMVTSSIIFDDAGGNIGKILGTYWENIGNIGKILGLSMMFVSFTGKYWEHIGNILGKSWEIFRHLPYFHGNIIDIWGPIVGSLVERWDDESAFYPVVNPPS